MSASQITPRANPIPLPEEKSLPEPPAASSPNTASASVASTSYFAHTVKALPPRPPLQRSWTEHRPVPAEPTSELHWPRNVHGAANTASFRDSDFQLHAQHLNQNQRMDSLPPSHSESSPLQQPSYSPYPTLPDLSHVNHQPVNMPSTTHSSTPRRPPRPSLPAAWKSNTGDSIAAPATPPRFSSADSYPSSRPSADPSRFTDSQTQDSPLVSQRTDSYFTPFPSDSSVRASSSTHNSMWTEPSLASCTTSPACTPQGLQFDDAAEHAGHKRLDATEATEELDENAVGLGITSDQEHDTSSRRSSAVPVLPAHVLPNSARVLQGPFSHHRAPSWTRRIDISPLAGSPSHRSPRERGDSFVALLDDARRFPGLGLTAQMQRALSDVTPVSPPSSEYASANASASSTGSPGPSIPLRRDSRIRCSSDSINYQSSPSSYAKHSPSHSISSIASNSGRLTPAVSFKSTFLVAGDLSSLQSPPRSSSLKPSPSASSLSPLVGKEGSQRKKPTMVPLTVDQKISGSTTEKTEAVNERDSVMSVEDVSEAASDLVSAQFPVPAPSLRTISAASRSRRVSDVSINSFLQNGEFNHIVGAYSNRMRWEEGLYDFDETAETDGDESRAVKTAEEGSATIVEGRHLTLAQIEAETGPNTTHLLLKCNQVEGLVEVLERVLPLTTNLLVLDLSNCKLDRLPDAIGACIALEELDISGNLVGCLPDWILNLRALRTLSADGIGLAHLPSSLIQLQELQRLSLRNNQLVFLPSWLHRMSKLSNLFVEGNHFRGPWCDIVAPLLAQANPPLATPFQGMRQRPPQNFASVSTMHTPLRSAAQANLAQVPSRPFMPRIRSANDLQTMLNSRFGPQTPLEATQDSQNDDDGCNSPIDVHPRPVTAHEDATSYAEEADPNATGGKWGGFLKKIGRKASSHRLASAHNDQVISPSQSRFSSPRLARKSLRSSGGPARSNSKSGASAPAMTSSQSEPIPPPSLPSLNLAAVMDEHRASRHAPMTPLEAASAPITPCEPTGLLQPINLDTEAAKKAKRRSFLPVHAFANAGAGIPQMARPLGLTALPGSPEQELDEESLYRHRNRLRALMHYLRDLDDLAAARTEAAAFVEPSKSMMAHIQDAGSHSRRPSMHRAESSNPSTKSRDSGGEYVASTVASSISEGASSEPARLSTARCSKDDSVRRFRIIAEIISTERTYVKGLSELVDIYVKPSLAPADGSSGVAVIPPNEHRAVFGNVEALLQFHRTVFLPSLVAVASPVLDQNQDAPGEMDPEETASCAEKIASVFSTHAAFFKMYTSYINNCDSAQNRISAWMAPSAAGSGGGLTLRGVPGKNSALQALSSLSTQEGSAASIYPNSSASGAESTLTSSQRKKIKTFMKRCRTHPRHAQLNVESYLLLPVQRIPRYRLLLEDLVKSTDTARLSDPEALATALEHVTQIASKVNESKRQSEQDRKLLAWQYRIRGPMEGPLVQPHRRLLKDGSLQLKRTVRRIPGFVRSTRSASVGGPEAGALRDMASVDNVLSADHLQQVTEDQSMVLILCSDVAVLCVEQVGNRDPVAPVLLRSTLKLMRPVEILGGVNLRVVDRSEILYLAAASPAEAVAWKTAFDLHFYQ